MEAHVIKCNDTVEHVHIGTEAQAKLKMNQLRCVHREKTYRKDTYDNIFFWHIRTVRMTVSYSAAQELIRGFDELITSVLGGKDATTIVLDDARPVTVNDSAGQAPGTAADHGGESNPANGGTTEGRDST